MYKYPIVKNSIILSLISSFDTFVVRGTDTSIPHNIIDVSGNQSPKA